MEIATDTGHQITARKLMENALYDNGCIDSNHPDDIKLYPQWIFDKITKACEAFFTAHPELLTDENLDDIACGILDENEEKFGIYDEYADLDAALNEYFTDVICS